MPRDTKPKCSLRGAHNDCRDSIIAEKPLTWHRSQVMAHRIQYSRNSYVWDIALALTIRQLILVQWRNHRFRRTSSNSTSKLALEESLPSDSDSEITLTQSQATYTPVRATETPSQLLAPPQGAGNRARSRSRDRRTEPQGLNVLYEPPEARSTDIIFVHGLGGSSISTWVKDGDHTTFWPKEFLPLEPSFSTSRILSFGYTAFFLSSYASGKLNVMDFARSLLANMKNETELGLGQASDSHGEVFLY